MDAPDRAWSADITYVRQPTRLCYLASIIDEYSRYCVGWSLSRWIDTRLTLSALEMALEARSPAAGSIHHSDHRVCSMPAGNTSAPSKRSMPESAWPLLAILSRTLKLRASSGL